MLLEGDCVSDYMGDYYPESAFGGFTDIDGTITFYTRVNALIRSSSVVLDVGCGRGAHSDDPVAIRRDLQVFTKKCQRVIGIDVDEAASQNPFLDEFRLIENVGWPVKDDSVDLSVCDWVLEHVQAPKRFFAEWQRVIKPGGYVCIRTPNLLSYGPLLSRLIPRRYHAAIIQRIQGSDRERDDIFPAYYRCNTIWRIRKIFDEYGFDHCVYGHAPEPSALSFSRLCYFLGVMYQRLAPGFLRPAIFAFAKKR